MKRSEFLKRGGTVAVLAVVAPRVLVKAATDAPALAPAATRIAVNHSQMFRCGDIVRVMSSGEALMVTSVPTSREIEVVRGLGGVEPQPLARGDQMLIVAGAVEQGAEIGRWSEDRLIPRVAMVA